jgi:alcohol dehydrogenase
MFDIPTLIKFGAGVADNVGEEAKKLAAKKVLIVSDKGVVKVGLADKVSALLQTSGIEFLIFDEVEPNPRDKTIEKGTALARQEKVDTIVAVGGGASMDTAKAIAMLVTNGGSILDYRGRDKVKTPPLPVVVVPTTAGTGSEVSLWTNVDDTSTTPYEKVSVGSRLLYPRVLLEDPSLTVSLPAALTATIAMDGLTTAIEAYTSPRGSPLTDALALKSIELMARSLPRAYVNGGDLEARAGTMLAGTLAGIAFANSSIGAVHSMGLAVSNLYDTPHGISVAIFLPFVMEFNLVADPQKYADIALAMGVNITGLSTKEASTKSVEAVRQLMRDINIPTPEQIGAKEEDIPEMAKIALACGASRTTLREPTEEDFVSLFERALKEPV